MAAELNPTGSTDGAWIERLYWLVRAMCMASSDTIPSIAPQHVKDAVLHTLSTSRSSASDHARHKDLIDILVIYFLSQEEDAPLIEIIVRAGTTISSHRLALARLLCLQQPTDVSAKGEHVMIRQLPDWIVDDQTWESIFVDDPGLHKIYRTNLPRFREDRLSIIEEMLTPLESQPVRLHLDDLPPAQAVQILRGLTPEIHRPLRHALVEAWDPSATSSREAIRNIIVHTLRVMSVRPTEFEEDVFWKRVESDPAVWFGAFVTFADRARVLPQMMDVIMRKSEMISEPKFAKLVRIAQIFRRWDRALTNGAGSHFVAVAQA